MGLGARRRLYVGVGRSLGMDALLLWIVELHGWFWMVLESVWNGTVLEFDSGDRDCSCDIYLSASASKAASSGRRAFAVCNQSQTSADYDIAEQNCFTKRYGGIGDCARQYSQFQ